MAELHNGIDIASAPAPMWRRTLGLATLVLVPGTAVFAQSNSYPRAPWALASSDEIRTILADRLAANGVGMVVGVIGPEGRRVIAHGRSGAPDGRPLDGDTVFQIGSVTKVFTGLLLAEMVVRGEVGLEDPAAKYLPPGVRMPQKGRPTTLLDLSKHWAALPSMPTNFSLEASPNPYTAYTEQQLYDFLAAYDPPRAPGTQEYSNLGVALLGRLLARRGGLEYEALLRERVLTPLGLVDTSITLGPAQRARLAPGHDRFLEPIETWELVALPASGSLRSSVNDLLTFLAFNLGLRDSPLNAAMTLQRVPGRALGWGASRLGGDSVYGHEGGKEGYRSAVVFNARTRTGVVVLANARTTDSPMALARHLLHADSALPPPAAAPRRPSEIRVDAKVLDACAGRYRTEAGTTLTVAPRHGRLLVDVAGNGVQTFVPAAERTFFSLTEDEQLTFERDAQGAVTTLLRHTKSTRTRATRVRP